jgi:hypothetical protein
VRISQRPAVNTSSGVVVYSTLNVQFMLKAQRPAWLSIGIIVLAILLNVSIINRAFVDNQNLFWMLIISIPLLIISIYSAWRSDHFLQKYFTDIIQPSTRQSHLKWSHSIYPNGMAPADLKVQIGNDQCSQPYTACILNIGLMKDANFESTFIQAQKQKEVECYEYSLSDEFNTYHLAAGGLVWRIGSDYTGCRTKNGHFDNKAFKRTACRWEVKMIELKLSSAIKPIYGVDSFPRSTEPINGKMSTSIFSGSAFSTFRDADGMIHFLSILRELSGGKPVGIRLRLNDKKEFYQICHAIRKAQIIPDFIVIEGSLESLSKVHSDQSFHTGMPLYEAILFVSRTLQIYGLQDKIKLIVDGKIISSFDILKVLALGADLVCTEMSRYVPIKYPADGELSRLNKIQSVYDVHDTLMLDTIQLMSVWGFKSVGDITLSKFFKKLDVLHSKIYDEVNAAIVCPIPVQKMYTSKIKHHRSKLYS